MSKSGSIPLIDHMRALDAQRCRFEDIIRSIETRHADREAEWVERKFHDHNDILKAWLLASKEDRENFVKLATFEGLKDAFTANTVSTAKALTLAEGKTAGFSTVVAGATFVAGLLVAGLTVWAALHH